MALAPLQGCSLSLPFFSFFHCLTVAGFIFNGSRAMEGASHSWSWGATDVHRRHRTLFYFFMGTEDRGVGWLVPEVFPRLLMSEGPQFRAGPHSQASGPAPTPPACSAQDSVAARLCGLRQEGPPEASLISPHCTSRETEAQRSEGTCLRPCNWGGNGRDPSPGHTTSLPGELEMHAVLSETSTHILKF